MRRPVGFVRHYVTIKHSHDLRKKPLSLTNPYIDVDGLQDIPGIKSHTAKESLVAQKAALLDRSGEVTTKDNIEHIYSYKGPK